jgi:DNA-binding CsgD family transcriptional regulator
MTRLAHRQLRAFSEALLELYAPASGADFPAHLFRVVRRFLSCDFVCYAEYVHGRNKKRITDPPTPEPTNFDVFDRYLDQLPTLNAFFSNRTTSAAKISDFTTLQQWHRTELYNSVFRPKKLSYQLMFMAVHESPQAGLAVNRSTRDFTEDERTLLNLLRPHFVQAYRASRFIANIAKSPGAAGHAVIVASGEGRILSASPLAELWLATYFKGLSVGYLPATVLFWLKKRSRHLLNYDELGNPLGSLVCGENGRRLRIHAESEPQASLHHLVLSEEPSKLSAQPLETLGLTRRESEVLLWMSQGKSNGDIGKILGMKERTVCKHSERVFLKLCVENRTSAANVALARLGQEARYKEWNEAW